MYILPKADVPRLLDAIAARYELFGPVVDPISGDTLFDRASAPSAVRLDAPIPVNTPKFSVFPHFERILTYRYDRASKALDIRREDLVRPKALVGVRSCDLTGLLCFDRFFLGQEFVDEVYRDHRRKMLIVANTCVRPFAQCFCVCTDSGPAAVEGFDVNLTDLGEAFLFETGSDKGRGLASELGLAPAGEHAARDRAAVVNRSIGLFDGQAVENKAWISRAVNRLTTGFVKPETWEYIGQQCFECGACSFVCPSCSCFNVQDAATQAGPTDRLRTWDSCSFEGYSRMAGEHNPRRPIEDRRNKRFFCKLSYSQSKKYLRPGCVGCGRCARVCPGDIGLPNVVTAIRREITEPKP
ncbi:MAG: 4Fe-4S dicluster domain-containing protein [Acidobacteriota bacterium]|nr:4Fe-4S dicluster domain-containing protein [Acidobacteriota bacterium]